MKRKLLVIAGLLGICLMDGINRPALANPLVYPFCSNPYCGATADPDSLCTCPPGTVAFKLLGFNAHALCNNVSWYAECNYL